jgi:hypothetical protein
MLPRAIRWMSTPEKRKAFPEGLDKYGPAVLDKRPYGK